ncbi:hypothetical protein [Streptomyces incanus]|uniref:hypothetical protein n=1 Tax=Streptomyces incanus TaxID=887453 RepID=UPI0036D422AA
MSSSPAMPAPTTRAHRAREKRPTLTPVAITPRISWIQPQRVRSDLKRWLGAEM